MPLINFIMILHCSLFVPHKSRPNQSAPSFVLTKGQKVIFYQYIFQTIHFHIFPMVSMLCADEADANPTGSEQRRCHIAELLHYQHYSMPPACHTRTSAGWLSYVLLQEKALRHADYVAFIVAVHIAISAGVPIVVVAWVHQVDWIVLF